MKVDRGLDGEKEWKGEQKIVAIGVEKDKNSEYTCMRFNE